MDASILTKSSLFEFLTPDQAQDLVSNLKPVLCREEEVLFEFGDSGDCLYIVESGHVELFVRDHSGQKVVLKVVGSGDMFGELSLLDNGQRTATATALEACQLWVLDEKHLLKFLRSSPEAALHLLAALGSQIRQSNNLLRSRVAKNLNEEVQQDLNWAHKCANVIADFSGSIPFLLLNVVWFLVWVVINLSWIPGVEAFDPFPFGLLTTIVSLEAIMLSIFVLLAQNLQSAKDKIRSDIEYEVNLKAELEVAYLHEKVDQMNAALLRRFDSLEKNLKN